MANTTGTDSSKKVPADWILSERLSRCESSPLRDVFAAIEQPGVISFAGGLPDTQFFPDLGECLDDSTSGSMTQQSTDTIFQYGASNGESALRNWAADTISASGLAVSPEQIIILSGSQQGIDLSAKMLIDCGTAVSVFYPTYLAALQSFTLFGAHYREITPDVEGGYRLEDSSVAYVNSTFSNPTSVNLTLQQRRMLALACDKRNTVLIEDDAYRELFYSETDRQPVCSFLKQAGWIYLSSFSKTIAPGLRIGFMAVCEELLPYMTRLKQAADLHSCRLAQHCIERLLQKDEQPLRLQQLREHYRGKRDCFDAELKKNWSDIADWESPCGGMFFWLRLKYPLDIPMPEVLQEAIKHGVAFMPGEYFYPTPSFNRSTAACTSEQNRPSHQPTRMLRLNFTNASVAEARYGLEKLAELLRNHQVVSYAGSQTPR